MLVQQTLRHTGSLCAFLVLYLLLVSIGKLSNGQCESLKTSGLGAERTAEISLFSTGQLVRSKAVDAETHQVIVFY